MINRSQISETVTLVSVGDDPQRSEDLYLFADDRNADRFVAATNHGYDEESERGVLFDGGSVLRADEAECLIAGARAEAMERLGQQGLSRRMRDGETPRRLFAEVMIQYGDYPAPVRETIEAWIEEDHPADCAQVREDEEKNPSYEGRLGDSRGLDNS
jgi:hypothetical protein